MNNLEILHFMRTYPNNFLGVFALNDLPKEHKRKYPYAFILNTDTRNLGGQHWIAVYVDRSGRGEVFDSFGQSPPQRLAWWLSDRVGTRWRFNKKPYQFLFSSLCGAYCILFLRERLLFSNMDELLSFYFTDDGIMNDNIVRTYMKNNFGVSIN
jgi:hypothetical protein